MSAYQFLMTAPDASGLRRRLQMLCQERNFGVSLVNAQLLEMLGALEDHHNSDELTDEIKLLDEDFSPLN